MERIFRRGRVHERERDARDWGWETLDTPGIVLGEHTTSNGNETPTLFAVALCLLPPGQLVARLTVTRVSGANIRWNNESRHSTLEEHTPQPIPDGYKPFGQGARYWRVGDDAAVPVPVFLSYGVLTEGAPNDAAEGKEITDWLEQALNRVTELPEAWDRNRPNPASTDCLLDLSRASVSLGYAKPWFSIPHRAPYQRRGELEAAVRRALNDLEERFNATAAEIRVTNPTTLHIAIDREAVGDADEFFEHLVPKLQRIT